MMMNEQNQLFQGQQPLSAQPQSQPPQQQQQQQNCVIGAIKIKDGLFIGDEFAAQDLEFIVTNKVSHVINCAGLRIANMWEQIGVMYLTFPWMESDEQVLFDEQDEILNEIVKFIDEAANAGESTLVHSLHGQSRACCVLAAYFMKKYNWSLLKTLEFLNSRRADLEIRASFFCQLTQLERKLQSTGQGAMVSQWMTSTSPAAPYSNNNTTNIQQQQQQLSSLLTIQEQKDEELIRNTYLNSRNGPIAEMFLSEAVQRQLMLKEKKDLLTWTDLHHCKPLHVASNISALGNQNIPPVVMHRRQYSLPLKPAIKGSHRKQLSVGSAGDMRVTKGTATGGITGNSMSNTNSMNRQFSGKQIGVTSNNNTTNNNISSNNHSRTNSAGAQLNKNNTTKSENNSNNNALAAVESSQQQQQPYYTYQPYQQSSSSALQQQQQQQPKRLASPLSGIAATDKDSIHPFELQPNYPQQQQQQLNQIASSYLSPQPSSQLSTTLSMQSQPTSSLLSHAQSPSQSLVNSSQLPPYSLQQYQQQQSQQYQSNSMAKLHEQQQQQQGSSQSVSATATLKQLSSPQANPLKAGSTKQTSTFLNNAGSNNSKPTNNNNLSTVVPSHSSVINRSSSLRAIENSSSTNSHQQQQQEQRTGSSYGVPQHPHKSNSFSLQQQQSSPLDSQSNTLRSNSLPKSIENERSPSAKLAYQLAASKTNNNSNSTAFNSTSSSSSTTTVAPPAPTYESSFQPASVISYLQSPQQSRNSAEKHRPNQNNYMRNPTPPSASHVVKHPPSDQATNPSFSSYQNNTKNPAASQILLNASRSPNASSSKATASSSIKHERPPLKPREGNSNGSSGMPNSNNSVVNNNSSNCNTSMNTSLSKSFHGKQHQQQSSSPSPIRSQQQQVTQQPYQQSSSSSYGLSSAHHPLQALSYLSSTNTMMLSNPVNAQHNIIINNTSSNSNSFINQTNSSFINTNNNINSGNLNNNSSFASQLNNNSSYGNASFIAGTQQQQQQQPLQTANSSHNNNNNKTNIVNSSSGFSSNNPSNNNNAEFSSKLLISNNNSNSSKHHQQTNSTKPPSAKPFQSKTSGKENVNALHSTYIPHQPLQNNFLSKDTSLFSKQQQLSQQQQQTQKNIPAYRSFSPDLSSLQNKLDKQKQAASSTSVTSTGKNRVRSNSPATALNYTSSSSSSSSSSAAATGSGGILSNQSGGMGMLQQFKRAQR